MSEDEQVSAAMSTALRASGVRILEHAGTIERFEPSSAGVRLLYSEGDAQAHVDATLAVVAVGWVASTNGLNLAAAGVRNRPARLHRGGLRAPHDRARHLRCRRRHRAPDGRPRGRARGLPGRDQRNPRARRRPPRRGQPARQLHRPRICLRRAHRGDRTRVARRRRRDRALRLSCRAQSSTVARRGSASSSPSESITRSSAATSSVSEPSSSPNWRRSRWRPA